MSAGQVTRAAVEGTAIRGAGVALVVVRAPPLRLDRATVLLLVDAPLARRASRPRGVPRARSLEGAGDQLEEPFARGQAIAAG